jgi:purine nucleosidase
VKTKETNMPRRFIFDTDTGIDDAMALLFLLRSPELALEGVTTVFGNSTVDNCTRNALTALEVGGRPDVPVARGSDRPLLRPYRGRGYTVHGENGLGDVEMPLPKAQPQDMPAAQYIVERVMAAPKAIGLIAVGPLTNLALALRLEPRIAQATRQVIVMGGAATVGGNATAAAEANIYIGPASASVVFSAGWPLTMVGLDVTTQVIMDKSHLARLEAVHTPLTDFIVAIADFYVQSCYRRYGIEGVFAHDSVAVAFAVDPTLFEAQMLHVVVDTADGPSSGRTVADLRPRPVQEPNVNVCLQVDEARLLQLYFDRIVGQG